MDENNLYTEQQPVVTKKKKSPLLFIIPVVIVAFLVVFFAVPPVLSNSLASKGHYDTAIKVININPMYKKDISTLRYEQMAYKLMTKAKNDFYSPDTIKARNLYYWKFDMPNGNHATAIILKISAETDNGGNTFDWCVLTNQFDNYGYTLDLDKTETQSDDDEEQLQAATARFIQTTDTVGKKKEIKFNKDRLTKAIQSIK